MNPRSGRDFEGLTSVISLSTCSVSPGRVGRGQEISPPAPIMPPAMGGGLPAAALTAYTRPADRQRVLEAGFQDFLAKPVHPNELVTLIARLAGRVRTPKR